MVIFFLFTLMFLIYRCPSGSADHLWEFELVVSSVKWVLLIQSLQRPHSILCKSYSLMTSYELIKIQDLILFNSVVFVSP